jgi:hypothetical protein
MSKDFPKTAEGGTAAPADKPERVGPVAGNVDPEPSTKVVNAPNDGVRDATADIQRAIDEAAKTASAEKPVEIEAPVGTTFLAQSLRLPKHVRIKGVVIGTPEEHAKALGGVKTVTRAAVVGNQPASFELYHQFHAGAEALHGWREHAHHAGEPIKLSADDYKAALKAASEPKTRVVDDVERKGQALKKGAEIDSHKAAELGVPVITDYEPHAPALSPHKGKGL